MLQAITLRLQQLHVHSALPALSNRARARQTATAVLQGLTSAPLERPHLLVAAIAWPGLTPLLDHLLA